MLLYQITIFANGSDIESTNINNESAEAMEMNNSFCCSSFSDATEESLRLRDNGDSLNATTNTVVFELNSEQQVVELNCESDGLTVVSNNYQNGLVYVTFTYNDNVIAPMLTVAALLEDDTILTANMYGYYFDGRLFVSGASTDDAFEKYCLFLLNSGAIDENQYKSIRNTYYKQSVSITTSTEPAMQAIAAPGTAETQAASKTTYVKGYITWNDDRGIEHPCQHVKVNVYDKEAWNPQLLATTYTNVGGFYSVTFENEDIIWELGCDLYIEVFAEGETVSVKNTSGVAYSISTVDEVINNVGNGTTSTISIKFEMIDDGYFVGGDLARAMQVSQPAIVASRYAKVMNNSQSLDQVEVYYPVDDDGCRYVNGTKRIYISGRDFETEGTPKSYASWDVIMHEYGHHVQNVIGNISDNPGGTHFLYTNMADHHYEEFFNEAVCPYCLEDELEIDSLDYCRIRALKISWAEAWATVFGFMAQDYYINSLQNIEFIGNAWYEAYNMGSLNAINLETYVDDAPGETNETSIITILYNLYDSNENDFDSISLGHQGFWNAIVNSESSVLSDFISYILGTNIVNEDDLSNLLDYQEVNAKPLHNPVCYTTSLPTFHWEARGGSNYFENNEFELILYDIYGGIVLEIPGITTTHYKLTGSQWQTVLSSCGDQFQWAVVAYQTDGMETGPYRSVKSETVTVPAIPLYLDIAVQGSIEEVSGYDWYKFTPSSSGTYTFYTTGTTDTYADVFEKMVYGIRTDNVVISDDDSGDSNNFKITCWLSAGSTIFIRVRAFSNSTGNYTLYAHEE